ncbi:LptF/LptG family permease, partial [Akkermansiaceae bacterium]|nr:LptF/LptG family permease [Akkermansiaceae bacterium]
MINSSHRFFYPIVLAIFGTVFSALLFPMEYHRACEHLIGFPDESHFSHMLRPYLLVLLSFIPFLITLVNAFCGILDRYLFSQFMRCFLICFLALTTMLVLMELQNRASTFITLSIKEVLTYFLIQLPQMMMMIIPYSLLLSLLWVLGKLSKSKELVSMIQGGRSILRLIVP